MRLKIPPYWLLLLLSLTLSGCTLHLGAVTPTAIPTLLLKTPTVIQPTQTPAPFPGTTPTYTPSTPLLVQVASVGPLYATGDSTVPLAALKEAGLTLAQMLRHRPDLAIVLRRYGAFIAVASRSERICDLSYFSQYDASVCDRYGEGGAGATLDHPITACDEKNLLKEVDDPYQRGTGPYSQNICLHELAHMIMDVGLSQTDLNRISARFEAVQKTDLWTGDYAMTNDMEFWAVMSQFYFSAGPNQTYSTAFNHIANGPEALKAYDPLTFQLLDSIYQGTVDMS